MEKLIALLKPRSIEYELISHDQLIRSALKGAACFGIGWVESP